MAYVTCPYCRKELDIETEAFPDTADEVEIIDCPVCNRAIEISWSPVYTAGKTDAGEDRQAE